MTGKTKSAEEFRMSAKEFERIMGKALRVKPDGSEKTKKPRKSKSQKK